MDNHTEDRISKYLSIHNRDMLFAELSNDYLSRIGAAEILRDIPVPISAPENDSDYGEVDVKTIVIDMAKVVGGDSDFLYAKQYLDFIKLAAADQAEPMLVAEGARNADNGDFYTACMLLRAALRIEPKSRAAMYLYGRVCKQCQELSSEDEEKAAKFKAEAIEVFELLTMIHPEFAMGYYFLGFEYLNLGLYLKTKLTWQDFLKYSSGSESEIHEMDDSMLAELRAEISDRLEELEDPISIEMGCNKIMSGDYQGGKELLDKYKEGMYTDWWPLWHYLGIAEVAMGDKNEAEKCFKRVLQLSPSNTDAMEELAAIYALEGDEVNAAKYRNKIKIVRKNNEAE